MGGVCADDLIQEALEDRENDKVIRKIDKNGHYEFKALLSIHREQRGDYPPPNLEVPTYCVIEHMEFDFNEILEDHSINNKKPMKTIEDYPNFLDACKQVANDFREIAHNIRKEDCYASHVSEENKIEELQKSLERADRIEAGIVDNFTVWQRVNEVLTGECVALLP